MKSVEEGEAGSAGVAGPLMRPLYFPRLTGSRAGQGHSRGMKREEKGEGDSIALTSTEKGEERAVGVARVPFISRCRRLLKQKTLPGTAVHVSRGYSEGSSGTTHTVIF